MKILVDRGRCVGAGMCMLTAPAVFDQDPVRGLVQLIGERPDPKDVHAVREAIDSCPSGALSLDEEMI